mgnify:FL=1
MSGSITFVGAGPGAADLITVRGKRVLDAADVVIYAGSLVDERLLDGSRAEKYNSAGMDFDAVMDVMIQAWNEGKQVVRLHTGDPAMYGAVGEQFRALDERGIPYEVVPGVSSVFAAAAALKTEFTMPGVSQTAILTRAAGRTPVPEGEELTGLAAHGSTLCLFLSVGNMRSVTDKLLAAGRSPETPAAVVYRAGWENQQIVRGTVADIAERVREAGIRRQAIVIVGDVLNRTGGMSLLYDRNFAHGYRRKNSFTGRSAVFALTSAGVQKAAEIAAGIDGKVIVAEKYAHLVGRERAVTYRDGGFREALRSAWAEYDGLVMVMASGIVVRSCAGLCTHKASDPAVVVVDERGCHAVSLLSGHLGGANRLAADVASVTGGEAVVTTASDVRGIMAVDEFAARHAMRVLNPEMIVRISSAALEGNRIDFMIPEPLFRLYYGDTPNFHLVRSIGENPAVVLLEDGKTPEFSSPVPVLRLKRRMFVLGMGCRKNARLADLEQLAESVLEQTGTDWNGVRRIATADLKLGEPALRTLAEKHGLELIGFSAEALNSVEVPHPSAAAREKLGINSVSEASAVLGSGHGKLIVPKHKGDGVTAALAEWEEMAE